LITNNAAYVLPAALQEQIAPMLILVVLSIYLYRWNSESFVYKMERNRLENMPHRDEFIYDMRVVRSTRFNFSKRLEKKSKVKAFIVNILSVISIFVSAYLLANASGISKEELEIISISIIGLSLLALWMSLDTPASELLRKANDAHQCGREISEIYRAFKYDVKDISDSINIYEAILSRYSDNHDQLDRAKALYDDREKYPDKAKGFTRYNTVWRYYISCYSSICLAVFWCVAVVVFQFLFPL
jgi:hypothetical protein